MNSVHKICFRKMDYEEVCGICSVDSDDDKFNNESPSSHVCDNRIDEASRESWHVENEHSPRMIASRDQSQFHKGEKWKCFIAFLLLLLSFFVALTSLALTHDRLPDRKVYKPLPDVFLDNVKNVDFLLSVTEIQIMIIVNVCIVVVFFHKHRFVIAKRCFFLLSILYLYRSITFYVTVLPISSKTYYCSPSSNSTSAIEVMKRSLSLFSGMGLSINNKQIYCGDSIFSGHATILILGYLIIKEYSPNKLKIVHYLAMLNAISAIIFLLMAHAHYTIDVILAYYITTRLFWTYHSLCQCTNLSSKNYLMREWWMPIFNYFEKNSTRTITNEFESPWPLTLPFNRSNKN